MREILFRGKRIDNGEWVDGCYMTDEQDPTTAYIGYIFGMDGGILVHDMDIVQVDPQTVCQYTGLTDNNGRKIFEGDIVKVRHADGQEDYAEIAEVSWDDKNACFSPWNWQYQCDGCDLYCEIQSIEVIGNIFDNPELVRDDA